MHLNGSANSGRWSSTSQCHWGHGASLCLRCASQQWSGISTPSLKWTRAAWPHSPPAPSYDRFGHSCPRFHTGAYQPGHGRYPHQCRAAVLALPDFGRQSYRRPPGQIFETSAELSVTAWSPACSRT